MLWMHPGDELYGYMTLSKDWKDGVLSIIMRGMSKNFSDQVRLLLLLFPSRPIVSHSLSPLILYCTNNYGLRSLVAAKSIKSIVRTSHKQIFP